MSSLLTDDFHSIVINNRSLLDVRAPIEFDKGAFLNSTNIAILDDKQRELIGTKYKEDGNAAAVKLAEGLIKEEGKQERLQKWKEFLQKNPDAFLYCFRGGQRSAISQIWLKEIGVELPRLKGGYKAFRNYLMDETLQISKDVKTIIVGGRTGSGKTILLQKLKNMIDLEKLANHRGSSFGSFVQIQPTQINFENALAYSLIQFKEKNCQYLVIEHESHNIGKSFIPKPVYQNLMDGELILLEAPLEQRIEIIFKEYIEDSLNSYKEIYKDNTINIWANIINKSLDKIQKRVGGKLYIELKLIFKNSLEEHTQNGSLQGYKELIKKLLVEYYDPMYDYQIQKSKIPIIFTGYDYEVLDFINYKEQL